VNPWQIANKADDNARVYANRHYNRHNPESRQFAPPGRTLVLKTRGAFWITSWPYGEYVRHRWTDGINSAWICTAFRRESFCPYLASDLVRWAVAATRWYHQHGNNPTWLAPEPYCFVTFVDPSQVKPKRDYGRRSQASSTRPGRCYVKAGWVADGLTELGLPALILEAANYPDPDPPIPINWMSEVSPSNLATKIRKALR
jgi:hypothetical protein